MFYSTLFYLVFISQIIVISFYFPRTLMKLAKRVLSPAMNSSELDSQNEISRKITSYSRLNNVMIVIGLILLLSFVFFDLSESVTAVLASIGIYFLLQLSPLAIPGVPQLISDLKFALSQNNEHQDNPYHSSKLFDYVSPLQIGIALGLILIWLVMELLRWNGAMNTQLLKIGVFAFSQLFIIALIARNRFMIGRNTDSQEGINKGIEDPKIAVPLLIYVSVGLSVYSLAKRLLLDLDLHHIRPIMMSVFLLLLATLAFDRQIRDLLNQPVPTSATPPLSKRIK